MLKNKHINLLLFFFLFLSSGYSQNNSTKIINIDSVIIKKSPQLILTYADNFIKKEYRKDNLEIDIYKYRKENHLFNLFGIPVESMKLIVKEKKLIFIGINLEINNKNIKHTEKEFAKIFGTFNTEVSRAKGDQRKLYYNSDKTGFIIDAFFETATNQGSLGVAYITKEYIELK